MKLRNGATLAELDRCLVDGEIVTDAELVAPYRGDQGWAGAPADPLCVVVARSLADVVATMRWATRQHVPVVPRGAGTGLAGGANATDGCVVLSLAQMTAIQELSVADQLARVEPGVITADLARAADECDLMYAPDPGSANRSTIGGNLATNAGGFRCCKYGVTRDSVLALDVVLADGRRLAVGRRTAKGVTGYDLASLFVGSEGTLGVIVGATVRLRHKPTARPAMTAAFFRDVEAAARAPAMIARAGLEPSLLELADDVTLYTIDRWQPLGLPCPGAALIIGQFDTPNAEDCATEMAKVCRRTGAVTTDVTTDAAEAERMLDIRRSALSAVERLGRTLVEDFVVPRSRLPEMLATIRRIGDRHGVLIATVVHAGDGNLHPTVMFDSTAAEVPESVWAAADDMFRAAMALGGTLTGEHGVGVLKRRWLRDELGDDSLSVHRAIKAALDPLGILNPGKVL